MKTNCKKNLPAAWLGIVCLLSVSSSAVWADTLTWWGTGTSGNWSDTLNWTNLAAANAAPANGDNVVFEAPSPTATPTNDLSGLSIGSMTIDNGNFDFFGTALTLSSGITNLAGDNVVDLPLILSASQTFQVDGSSLTFNKGITNGGFALAIAGASAVNMYGQNSGAGSLVMNGTGTMVITNRQPLTGGIVVNSGTLNFNIPGNLNFGGAESPSLITINTNGTVLNDGTHAIGGGTAVFVNRGDWKLDAEDYKQNLTMWDGTIEPGPSPNSSGGQLRVGFAGGGGTFTWFVTNSIAGSTISSPLSTVGSTVNLILNVARGAAPSDLTISGPIVSSGSITLAGNGITTLSGANTHTGPVTIGSGGKLVLQSQLWSTPITVASGATFDISGASFSLTTNQVLAGVGTVIGSLLDNNAGVPGAVLTPGGNNVAGTLTMDGLSLSGNGLQLNFDLSNIAAAVGGGTNDLLLVTNFNASAGVTNTVNISFLNGTPQTGVAYTLIKYVNAFGGDPAQFLTASASRYAYTFTNDITASAIKVIITGTPGNLVWRGDGVTNNWDVNTSQNWKNGLASDFFLQGDNATFDNNGSNTPAVNIVGTVQPTLVTVNSTKDYTLGGSGKISSGAKLLKSNSGNLTVLTANDNTGGGSLTGSGTITVGNGGSTVANIGSGIFTNNNKVTFYENASATYSGTMTGTGGLVANMPGATLIVTGTNAYSGGTTIANGTFQIGNNTAGVSPSVSGTITNYSTLNIYRSDAFTNQNNITSLGNTLEYGPGDINVRGTGGMTVDGSGSINTYPQGSLSIGQSASGLMTVNSGAIINIGGSYLLGNPNAVGNYGVVTQNNGTITVGNQVRIGHWASEISTNIMNGGTLNVMNSTLGVGWDGIGIMVMNGGTVNARTLNVDDNGATAAIGGINSTFTMNGGTLNIGTGGIGGNTATIILNSGTIGTLVPSSLIAAGWSSGMAMSLTNSGPTFDSSNSVITLSGVLSGRGGLTKQGSGYLNLNGVNTYTNVTTVAAGTLEGSGTIVGPITVNSGAKLSAGTAYATGTLTTSNVTVNAGGNVVIDASSTNTTSDLLFVKGVLALDAATPLTMNFLGGIPFTGGVYTVITNLLPRTGHLVLSNPTRYAATVDETHPLRIQVGFSGANAALVWQGGVNTNWNVNTDNNWLNNGVADKYYQSDVVIFDGTGIAKSNVNLAATMTPASVTVDAAGDYSFTGSPIAGVATLTKSGTGKLTLLNSNAYLGVTTIAGGTLQVGNGTVGGSLPPGAVVNDYGMLTFNSPSTVAFNGAINGPGGLTQAGPGTLLVTATQNHYGGTTVNSGSTLQMGNGPLADSGSLGNGPVTNNGTVIFYRANNIGVAAPYTGNGAFVFQGTTNSGQGGYALNATNTFTGPVTLNYARIQSGFGAQSFGSPSSITVNPGSAVYAIAQPYSPTFSMPLTLSGAGWQDGLGALRMEGNGTWAGNITLANNTRIATTSASTNTITGTISGNFELETFGNNAAGAITLAPSAANSYNALRVSIGTAGTKTIAGNNNAIPNNIPLTMNGGTLWLNGFSKTFSPFYNFSSSSSIQNGSTTSPATITLAPVLGSSTYNGTFADGATQPLSVTFTQSPGMWSLALPTASPNWTGNLTNNGGTISSGTQNTPFGSQSVVGRNIVGNNGATFITTINNALASFQGNVILNNSSWITTRFISFSSVGSLYLANAMLNGTNNTDGAGFLSWGLPGTVTVRGTAPSFMLGSGTGAGFGLASPATTFDVADVTGNANPDLIVGALVRSGNALIKTGAGTMELDGANNNYTGATIINGGTLAIGAASTLALSSSVSVAGGATLDVSALSGGMTLVTGQSIGGSGTIKGSLTDGNVTTILPGNLGVAGTLTITTNLTLGGAGSLSIDLSSSTVSGNDKIQVNGNLTLSSSTPTPVTFNFLNGAPALGTPYTLIQCNGSISGTAATAFTNSTSRFVAVYGQTANSVTVTFTGSASNLVWTGTDPLTPNTWDVATSTNWNNGSGVDMFYQFDSVLFDNTAVAPANTAVTLVSTVTPATVTVDSTNDYNISGSGSIAGTGLTITKNNTNNLTLSLANTFTGQTVVKAGKLLLGGNSPLGANLNSVTVSNGAALDFNGDAMNSVNTRNYTYNIAGSGPDGNGALVNSGGAIFSFANISNLTLTADATIGGSGRFDVGSGTAGQIVNGNNHNLTKVGSGTMDFRPQFVTNLASLTITGGTLFDDSGFSFTNAATASTVITNLGATLAINSGLIWNMPLVLSNATVNNNSGSGSVVWQGTVSLTGTNTFGNSGSQAFAGVISGAGAIGISGVTAAGAVPGALIFSNANSFSGGVFISNAPVTIGAATAVSGSAAVVVTSSNALGTGPITFALSQMTTNTTTNTVRVMECNITGGGALPNAIIFPSASAGVTNISIQGRDSSSSFTLSGQISGGFTGLTNWVDFGDTASSGVMRLANNANSFVANIYGDRGVLAITGDGCLGNTANTVKLDQNSVNGGLRFDGAAINVAHNLIINSTASLDVFGDNNGDGLVDTANSATISSIISGGGAFTVKCGTNLSPSVIGTLTVSGNNTFSGALTVNQYVKVVAANANALGTTNAGTTVNSGGTLSLNLNGTYASEGLTLNGIGAGGIGALENSSGANVLNGNVTLASGTTIGATSGTLTLGGVVSGAFPMTKVGSGTLILGGTNTYSAGTLVNGGTLLVNGSLPVGNMSIVGSGATLGGNGTINGGIVLQSGGVLQPGSGGVVGKLTVNGPVNLAGNTVMYLNKAATTNSQLAGSSAVVYGGTLSVTNLGGTLTAGDTFTLFSTPAGSANFASIAGSPGAGLLFSFNPTNGVLSVLNNLAAYATNITATFSSGTLNITWPTTHLGWILQAQTNNIDAGLTPTWTDVAGSSSVTSETFTVDPTKPTVFFRLRHP